MKPWQSLILLLLPFASFSYIINDSEIQWNKINQWNQGLPSSVEVFQTNSSYNDTILMTAAYCQFNLSDPDLEFKVVYTNDGATKTLPKFIQEEQNYVYMIANAGYFDIPGGDSLSLIIENGQVLATNILIQTETYNNFTIPYYPTRGAFGLYENGTAEATWVYNLNFNNSEIYSYPQPSPNCFNCPPQFVPSATFPAGGSPWKVQQAAGGGPVLVKDGSVYVTTQEELVDSEIAGQRNPRTAICMTLDQNFIVLVVDGRYSLSEGLLLEELADVMLSLGCKEAMNLDGGGSTAMIVNGYLTNRPSDPSGFRPVPSVVMVVSKTKPNPFYLGSYLSEEVY